MDPAQLWSHLPAIITEYDPSSKKATVRCLVKMRYKDGSQKDFPEIDNVLIITPGTAFAGINLPVRTGDKVVLHIMDRDIQRLMLMTDTSGLQDPGGTKSDHARMHDMSDCVAYTGFGSFDSVSPSDYDVWIFNNEGSSSYNHIRLKQNGEIELRNANSTIVQTSAGQVNITAPTVTMSGNLNVQGSIEAGGNVSADGGNVTLLTHKHSNSGSSPINPS